MNRRQFVRNAAATTVFGSGFFRELSARAAGSATPPPRIIILCKRNGSALDDGNFRLPSGPTEISAGSALAPLRAFKESISVVSGMTYGHMKRASFGCHLADPFVLSAKAATLTSGRWDGTNTSYYESTGTASLDRFLAKRMAPTPVPALAIREATKNDSYISYESGPVAGRANPSLTADSPARVWEQLFGGTVNVKPDVEQAKRRAIDGVVATRLAKAYDAYRGRLAGWERAEVENQLHAVDSWRVKTQSTASTTSCQTPTKATGTTVQSISDFDLVSDMLVSALRCGITNVATMFWFGGQWSVPGDRKGAATRGGSLDEHGNVGHSGDESVRRCVDQWYVERYASLLTKLDAVPEGNGTMLDNSIVILANRDPDHNSHSINDFSWVIAGKGGGRLATGQSVRWPSGKERQQTPHARLLATLCAAVNVDAKDFTDAEPLRQLLA